MDSSSANHADVRKLGSATLGTSEGNDGNVYCNITIFDWTQPAARQVWMEAITNVTATGLVDGIYADHSCEKGVGIGTAYPTKDNGPNQLCNGVGESIYSITIHTVKVVLLSTYPRVYIHIYIYIYIIFVFRVGFP